MHGAVHHGDLAIDRDADAGGHGIQGREELLVGQLTRAAFGEQRAGERSQSLLTLGVVDAPGREHEPHRDERRAGRREENRLHAASPGASVTTVRFPLGKARAAASVTSLSVTASSVANDRSIDEVAPVSWTKWHIVVATCSGVINPDRNP